jgi:hypothetical protein
MLSIFLAFSGAILFFCEWRDQSFLDNKNARVNLKTQSDLFFFLVGLTKKGDFVEEMPQHDLASHFQKQLVSSVTTPTYRSAESPPICDCCGSLLPVVENQQSAREGWDPNDCVSHCYRTAAHNPGPCLSDQCREWNINCTTVESNYCPYRCSGVQSDENRRRCERDCRGAFPSRRCTITLPRTYDDKGIGHPFGVFVFWWKRTTPNDGIPIGGIVDFSSIWPTGAETLTIHILDFVRAWNEFRRNLVPTIQFSGTRLIMNAIQAGTAADRLVVEEQSKPWLSVMGFADHDRFITNRQIQASQSPQFQ